VKKLEKVDEMPLESQIMFEGLFEAAPDAIVLADGEGRILRVNQQAELMFGYSRGELHGKPIEALLPPRFRERHVARRSTYLAEPRLRSMGAGLELYGLRKDGSEFPVDIVLSPLQTGGQLFVVSVIRDITWPRSYTMGRYRICMRSPTAWQNWLRFYPTGTARNRWRPCKQRYSKCSGHCGPSPWS
jgi:PAS domain S-box-containing protein